jgi:hypothetical protein
MLGIDFLTEIWNISYQMHIVRDVFEAVKNKLTLGKFRGGNRAKQPQFLCYAQYPGMKKRGGYGSSQSLTQNSQNCSV